MEDIATELAVTLVFAVIAYAVRAPAKAERRSGVLSQHGGPLLRTGSHLVQLIPPLLILASWLSALGWIAGEEPTSWNWMRAVLVSAAYAFATYRWWKVWRLSPEPAMPTPGSLPIGNRWYHLGRLVALCLAVEICSVGLYAWTLMQDGIQDAIRLHFPAVLYDPPQRLRAVTAVVGFAYGQVVSGAFVSGLREGVATWGAPRAWQYAASAFPVVIGFTLCVSSLSEALWGSTAAPSLASGLVLRSILLTAGYWLTSAPPAGTFRTLRDLAAARFPGRQRLPDVG